MTHTPPTTWSPSHDHAADEDEAWLVEVYGDALTPELTRSEALLHVMTALALQPQPAATGSLSAAPVVEAVP